ncbi:MAG: glycosyltransferase family 4 protein [Gammaproteobacteria bacterium]
MDRLALGNFVQPPFLEAGGGGADCAGSAAGWQRHERQGEDGVSRTLRFLHVGNGRAAKIKAIVDAFLTRGHEIHMVPIPPIEGGWEGVTWHCLTTPPVPGQAKVLARLLQVRHLVRRLRPDVVHAHNAWGPGWYGAFAGLHPLVIHAYGGDLLPEQYRGRSALQRRLTSWACRSADRVIVTGKHMIEASTGLGIRRERLTVLPRGVDLEHYRPGLDTAELRERLGLGDATPVILSPRYQVDERLYNLDTVIDAFVAVRERLPRAVCVQLYDPVREEGRSRLEKAAAERGLGAGYRLVPTVDNTMMPLFYNIADAVVSVPSSDGFPVTVLEASACGAPLVVSSLPYCKEWFVDGENGLLVPVRDAKALAEAVLAAGTDPDLRQRLGAAGRRLVEEHADYRRCMDGLEAIYRDLLAKARRPRREVP